MKWLYEMLSAAHVKLKYYKCCGGEGWFYVIKLRTFATLGTAAGGGRGKGSTLYILYVIRGIN